VKIGLFGIQVTENCKSVLNQLVKTLIEKDAQLWIHPFFYELFSAIQKQYKIPVEAIIQSEKIPADLNYLITIGGDGTFLEAVSAINLQKIPLLGVNTGRLGFLADVSPGEIPEAIEALYKNEFRIEERSVIKATLFPEQNITFPFALNDLTVHKRDTSSMIAIQAYIDDVFLSQYWADGLIIATPTGSTAYSMSAGGPIVTPDSKNFIITPIASHNLTVRPLVIPDHHEISLKIESRDSKFLLSLDSRSYVMEEKLEVRVKKAETNVSLVKLMWGVDKRN